MADATAILFVGSDGPCIVVQRSRQSYAYIIRFDPIHGTPFWSGVRDFDTFLSVDSAKASLVKHGKFTKCVEAKLIYGLTIVDGQHMLSLITKIEEIGCLMDNQHRVYTVVSEQTVRLNIGVAKYSAKVNDEERAFSNFVRHRHFFCLTTDLSAPCGRPRNNDMIWNWGLDRKSVV